MVAKFNKITATYVCNFAIPEPSDLRIQISEFSGSFEGVREFRASRAGLRIGHSTTFRRAWAISNVWKSISEKRNLFERQARIGKQQDQTRRN